MKERPILFSGPIPMPKKCESCRHYEVWTTIEQTEVEYCSQPTITETVRLPVMPLDQAREICDREHDGHFFYFDPNDESPTGAAFVQITRDQPRALAATGGAR